MKLSIDQLNDTKKFIKKKGYTEPDLLIEILDHVACLVEEKMKSQPEIGFQTALNVTYSSFGIWGFSKLAEGIIKGRRLAIEGTIRRIMKTAFSFPYLFLVFGAALILFYGYSILYKHFIIAVPLVILMAYFGYYFGIIRPAAKPFREYLWVESTNNFTAFIAVGLNLFQPFVYLSKNTPVWAGLFSLWMICLSLIIISYFTFYNEALKKCNELQKVYGSVV